MNVDEFGARIIISFGDGEIFLSESFLLGILVAVVLAVLGGWLGTGLQTVPKGKQVISELIVGWVYKYTRENVGKGHDGYAPYVGTIFGFCLLGSALGLFGLRPITADVNVTFALSILTFLLIQGSEVRKFGAIGKIKHMCDPYPFMLPLKVLEELTLPISLGFRLFGNILGGLIVVDIWFHFMTYLSGLFTDIPFLRAVLVLPLNGFFDIFEPIIQTFIFTMLTMIFLGIGINIKKDH